MERLRASVERSRGGYDVIHQDHVPSGQLFLTNNSSECACNVPQSVAWSQARLRLSGSATSECVLHPDIPAAAELAGQELALVVAALPGPRGSQWHGNEQVALLCDVLWKVKPRHLFCHWLGQ